jgi:uncharacterized phage protein gp47/JayE
MAVQKTFDELLNTILTDYRNQFPEADTSKGSLIFIRASALASSLWGLYQNQLWISKQAFPDTADIEALEHHAWLRGINRRSGETDADLLSRLLGYIRRPPAGGNKYDYEKWALTIANVKAAYCIPLGQGVGTVDLVIVADKATTGSDIPTQELLDEVKSYIEDVRAVTPKYTRVLPPTIITQDVTINAFGASANKPQIIADATAYLNEFIPGQVFYRSQLSNIALINGADDATVPLPVTNIIPTSTQMIRAGVISAP